MLPFKLIDLLKVTEFGSIKNQCGDYLASMVDSLLIPMDLKPMFLIPRLFA